MRMFSYLILSIATYALVGGLGFASVFFFESVGLFIASYLSMMVGLGVLFAGMLLIHAKERHQFKCKLFMIHAVAFLLMHIQFLSYDSFSFSSLSFLVIPLVTLAALKKTTIKKHILTNDEVY